jgi:hypothetical protein
MPQVQSIKVVEPDFMALQGAYAWCCTMMDGNPIKTQQGNTEWQCHAEWPFDDPGDRRISFGSFFSFDPEIITDSKSQSWLKFQNLVKQWRSERGARSSITETVLMPSYQKIIGMGETAVPLLLAQLKSEGNEPDQWFWALRAISEANPVKAEDQGNFPKMAEAWLRWGEREGYTW